MLQVKVCGLERSTQLLQSPIYHMSMDSKRKGGTPGTINKKLQRIAQENGPKSPISRERIVKKVKRSATPPPDSDVQSVNFSSSSVPLFSHLGGSFGKPATSPYGFLQLGGGFGGQHSQTGRTLGTGRFIPLPAQGGRNGAEERNNDRSCVVVRTCASQEDDVPLKAPISRTAQGQENFNGGLYPDHRVPRSGEDDISSKSGEVSSDCHDQADLDACEEKCIPISNQDREEARHFPDPSGGTQRLYSSGQVSRQNLTNLDDCPTGSHQKTSELHKSAGVMGTAGSGKQRGDRTLPRCYPVKRTITRRRKVKDSARFARPVIESVHKKFATGVEDFAAGNNDTPFAVFCKNNRLQACGDKDSLSGSGLSHDVSSEWGDRSTSKRPEAPLGISLSTVATIETELKKYRDEGVQTTQVETSDSQTQTDPWHSQVENESPARDGASCSEDDTGAMGQATVPSMVCRQTDELATGDNMKQTGKDLNTSGGLLSELSSLSSDNSGINKDHGSSVCLESSSQQGDTSMTRTPNHSVRVLRNHQQMKQNPVRTNVKGTEKRETLLDPTTREPWVQTEVDVDIALSSGKSSDVSLGSIDSGTDNPKTVNRLTRTIQAEKTLDQFDAGGNLEVPREEGLESSKTPSSLPKLLGNHRQIEKNLLEANAKERQTYTEIRPERDSLQLLDLRGSSELNEHDGKLSRGSLQEEQTPGPKDTSKLKRRLIGPSHNREMGESNELPTKVTPSRVILKRLPLVSVCSKRTRGSETSLPDVGTRGSVNVGNERGKLSKRKGKASSRTPRLLSKRACVTTPQQIIEPPNGKDMEAQKLNEGVCLGQLGCADENNISKKQFLNEDQRLSFTPSSEKRGPSHQKWDNVSLVGIGDMRHPRNFPKKLKNVCEGTYGLAGNPSDAESSSKYEQSFHKSKRPCVRMADEATTMESGWDLRNDGENPTRTGGNRNCGVKVNIGRSQNQTTSQGAIASESKQARMARVQPPEDSLISEHEQEGDNGRTPTRLNVCSSESKQQPVMVFNQLSEEFSSIQERNEDCPSSGNYEGDMEVGSPQVVINSGDTDVARGRQSPEVAKGMLLSAFLSDCECDNDGGLKMLDEASWDSPNLSLSRPEDSLEKASSERLTSDAHKKRDDEENMRRRSCVAKSENGSSENAPVDSNDDESCEGDDTSMQDDSFADEDCLSIKADSSDFFSDSDEDADETAQISIRKHKESEDLNCSNVPCDGESPDNEETGPDVPDHARIESSPTSSEPCPVLLEADQTFSRPEKSNSTSPDQHQAPPAPPQEPLKWAKSPPPQGELLPEEPSPERLEMAPSKVSCVSEESGVFTPEKRCDPPSMTRKFQPDLPIIQFEDNSLPGLPDGVTGALTESLDPIPDFQAPLGSKLDTGDDCQLTLRNKRDHRIPGGYCFRFAKFGKCTRKRCKFRHVLLKDIPSPELKTVKRKNLLRQAEAAPPTEETSPASLLDPPSSFVKEDKQRVDKQPLLPIPQIAPLPPPFNAMMKPPLLPLPPQQPHHRLPPPLPASGPRSGAPSLDVQSTSRFPNGHGRGVPRHYPPVMADRHHHHTADESGGELEDDRLPRRELPTQESSAQSIPQPSTSGKNFLTDHERERDMLHTRPGTIRACGDHITENCPSQFDHDNHGRVGQDSASGEAGRVVDPLGRVRWLLQRNHVAEAWNEYRLKTREEGVPPHRKLLLEIIAELPRGASALKWMDCKEALLELASEFSEDTTAPALEILHQLSLLPPREEAGEEEDLLHVAVSIFQECVPAQNTVQGENNVLSMLSYRLLKESLWLLLHCFVCSQAEKGFTPSLESLENVVFKYYTVNNHFEDLMELMRLLNDLKLKLPAGFYHSVRQFLKTASRTEDILSILEMKSQYYQLDPLEKSFIQSQRSRPRQQPEKNMAEGASLLPPEIPAQGTVRPGDPPRGPREDPPRSQICRIIQGANNIKSLGNAFLTIYSEDRDYLSKEVIHSCFARTISPVAPATHSELYREFVQYVQKDPALQSDGLLYLACLGRSLFLTRWDARDTTDANRVLGVLAGFGPTVIPKVFINLSPEAEIKGKPPFSGFHKLINCLIEFNNAHRAYELLRELHNDDWDHHFWERTCRISSWRDCYKALVMDLMDLGHLDKTLEILVKIGEHHCKHEKSPNARHILKEPINRLLFLAFEKSDLAFLSTKVLPAIKEFSELSRETTQQIVTELVARGDGNSMGIASDMFLRGVQDGIYLGHYFKSDLHEGRIPVTYTPEEMYIAVCEYFHESDFIISRKAPKGNAESRALSSAIDRLTFRFLVTVAGTCHEGEEPGQVSAIIDGAIKMLIEQVASLIPNLRCRVVSVHPQEKMILISLKDVKSRYRALHPLVKC